SARCGRGACGQPVCRSYGGCAALCRARACGPAMPAQYLHATSRAVELASVAPFLQVASVPAVQAQITINATNSSPRAIGDELEHRMDTLRMQARQANMGQF
ncbi:MAG: hypothetical protein ABF436_09960, partial [Acetobacter okinawensis]|uniref:hypothetical protein n=1 Tax=Acetobacter okinawensis TaxID=1076594 RepID=UPI0039ED315C